MTRVVIVTGAGSEGGIGWGIVRRLTERGDHIAIVDINGDGAERNAEKVRAAGGHAVGYTCNVGERDSVFEAAGQIARDLGPAWGLVNGATGGPFALAEDFDEDTWRLSFDQTVSGALWWSQAVFPTMRTRGGGRIVNFGSEVSDHPTNTVGLNYVTGKGAVRSLTRGLACEWGRHGITVNMVWPLAATGAYKRWAVDNVEAAAAQAAETCVGRVGDPFEDIAPVVEFLLSEGSGYVTGATIPANGGRAVP